MENIVENITCKIKDRVIDKTWLDIGKNIIAVASLCLNDDLRTDIEFNLWGQIISKTYGEEIHSNLSSAYKNEMI